MSTGTTVAEPEPVAGRARRRRSEARRAERSEALGKYAHNSSPAAAGDRRDRRSEAWELRRRLWELSSLRRVRACGRISRNPDGGPTLRVSGGPGDRVAGLAGLVRCGSPWACPGCSRRIGVRRAEEIREVIAAADAQGGAAALITLTLRHHAGQRLADLWDAVSYGWSRITSGKAYQDDVERFGVLGWCRAVEVTHGEAGWHPHLHIIVIFDCPVSADLVESMAGRWWVRWERAIVRRGYTAVAARGGLDARVVTLNGEGSGVLGRYLAKIALEATGGLTKDGREGNRSPFVILRDGLATGLADDIEAWWEYEQASHGRKALTWANGTRKRFRLAPEQSDQDLADEEMGGNDLITLPAATWGAVRDYAAQLLDVAEAGGVSAATAWLDVRGLRWGRVAAPDRHRPSPGG